MPLALSLHMGLGPWMRGPLDVQAPFRRFLDRQAEVIARARGAFLSRWFGPSLPLEGLSVRVAFANLAALAARARSVAVTGRESPWDRPNLTEPLAGLAGITAGMWASPLNSWLLGVMIADAFPRWWTILLAGLNTMTGGTVGMVALFIAGAAGGGLLALAGLVGRDVPPLVGLLGSVAALAGPAASFWGQLSGPRAAVRNPVLREMLAILDSLAALVPQLVGAVAIVITAAVPQIPALTTLASYLQACWAAVRDAVTGMMNVLHDEFIGPKSPFSAVVRVLDAAGNSLERFADLLSAGWSYLGVAATSIGSQDAAALSGWEATIRPQVGNILSPVLAPLKAASQAFSTTASIVGRVFGGPSGPVMRVVHAAVRLTARLAAPAVQIYHVLAGPPSPPLPPAPGLGGFGAILDPFRQPPALADPAAVPSDLDAALHRLERPPRMFDEALAKFGAAPAKGPGGPAASVADLAPYLEVVRRLVPSALAGPFADLQQLVSTLPVRVALPAQELRVLVGALRVRLPDAQAAESGAWSTRLRRAMEMHAVKAPAAGPAAAGPAAAGPRRAR